jgi:hypothetical protein
MELRLGMLVHYLGGRDDATRGHTGLSGGLKGEWAVRISPSHLQQDPNSKSTCLMYILDSILHCVMFIVTCYDIYLASGKSARLSERHASSGFTFQLRIYAICLARLSSS